MDTILRNLDTVIAALLIFNVAVGAAQKVLEVVKDKTSTESDNKVYEFINKYAGHVQKAIDWISANRPHK
jgi:hypothetical protein